MTNFITVRGPGYPNGGYWKDGPGGPPIKAYRHDPHNWRLEVAGGPPKVINELELCFWDDTTHQVDCKATWEGDNFHIGRADGTEVGTRHELHYFNVSQGTEWWASRWDPGKNEFVSWRA
jgi:hypothetical protein